MRYTVGELVKQLLAFWRERKVRAAQGRIVANGDRIEEVQGKYHRDDTALAMPK